MMKNKIHIKVTNPFRLGDLIEVNNSIYKVGKTIKSTRFKRLLTKWGFNMYLGFTELKKVNGK